MIRSTFLAHPRHGPLPALLLGGVVGGAVVLGPGLGAALIVQCVLLAVTLLAAARAARGTKPWHAA